jgi:hypothetical protein
MKQSTDPRIVLQEFVRERNHVLLHQGPKELKAFMQRHNLPVPKNKNTLEITWHKSITAAVGLPREYRQKSKDWLKARGYRSLDDGDLI